MIRQRVLVTGADRGLGLEICRELLRQGWKVYAGQYMPDWKELETLRDQYPEELQLLPLDVSDTRSVKACADLIRQQGTSLDMLINNAAIYHEEGSIHQSMDFSLSRDLFRVNSLGPVSMTGAFVPLMQEGQKRLCYVSSEAGSIGACMRDQGAYGYSMSKAALNMAVRMIHSELQPRGFRIRLYHPGWLKTYMHGHKNEEATDDPAESALVAIGHFLRDESPEELLQMSDNKEERWPF